MRKIILAIALLILVLGGGLQAQDSITLRLAAELRSPAENQALQARVDQFMTQNPGIKVEISVSDDHISAMQTAFASGDYPEVFAIDSSKLPDWAEAGVVAPAGNRIEQPRDFYPTLIDASSYKGTLYCAPRDWSVLALEYNQRLFDAAGAPYPRATWTWDDLRAAA